VIITADITVIVIIVVIIVGVTVVAVGGAIAATARREIMTTLRVLVCDWCGEVGPHASCDVLCNGSRMLCLLSMVS
jgi:hypothetical protein